MDLNNKHASVKELIAQSELKGLQPYIVRMHNPLSLYAELILDPAIHMEMLIDMMLAPLNGLLEQSGTKMQVSIDGRQWQPPQLPKV